MTVTLFAAHIGCGGKQSPSTVRDAERESGAATELTFTSWAPTDGTMPVPLFLPESEAIGWRSRAQRVEQDGPVLSVDGDVVGLDLRKTTRPELWLDDIPGDAISLYLSSEQICQLAPHVSRQSAWIVLDVPPAPEHITCLARWSVEQVHLALLGATAELDIAGLRDLGRLRGLHASPAVSPIDVQLIIVGGLHQLVALDLARWPIDDAALARLDGLQGLRRLGLTSTRVTLTMAGLEHLASHRQLQSLDLSSTPIRNEGLSGISRLGQLRSLALRRTPIADAGLVHIAPLNQLISLDLGRTQTSNTGVSYLKGMEWLRSLSLEHTAVDDNGLAHLASLCSVSLDSATRSPAPPV